MRLLLVFASASLGGVSASVQSLAAEFAEASKHLDRVHTVGCVGPRLTLTSGEDAVRASLGVSSTSKGSIGVAADTVLVENREVDPSDAFGIGEEAVAALVASHVAVYAVRARDVRARGERRSAYLSGLVAALERALPRGDRKTIVIAVKGLDDDVRNLVSEDLRFMWSVLPPNSDQNFRVTVVDATDTVSLKKEIQGGQPEEGVPPANIARSMTSIDAPKRRLSTPGLVRVVQRNKKQAAEVTALKATAAAFDKIMDTDLEIAKANLGARYDLDRKFCPTYATEVKRVVVELLDKLDAKLDASAFETEAYARKRSELADVALAALDARFFEPQLALLAQDTSQRLRTGLKGLRVTKSVKPQTAALLKDAALYFDAKAADAFGPSRHWRGKRASVLDALSDYVTDRLQVARLQGTYVPDDPSLFKWPFPVAFSFHWLAPAAFGLVDANQRGLSPRDKALFKINEDANAPRFPIPQAVMQFSKNLIAASTSKPVE